MATEIAPEFVITDELARKIDRVLDEHEHDATQIVGVLLDVQDLIDQQYVPQAVAFYVAQKLPIKVSVIYDCLTFYSALSPTPRAKYPVQVCRSIACKVNGSDSLLDTVKKILGVEPGEVTYDGRFTIEEVSCFGACDVAPAIRINGTVYGHLDTTEKVRAVLEKFMQGGGQYGE